MRRLVFVALAACYTPAPPTCTGSVIVLAEAPDYSASTIGSLDPATGVVTIIKGESALNDPVLATSAGKHFAISRKTPTVIYQVDQCGQSGFQFSALAAGESDADPQDVAVASNGAMWVARFFPASLLVFGSPTTTIDLSKFDPDGNPDMSSVRIVGNHAFVALGRLTQVNTTYVAQQTSQVIVLDTDTLTLATTISLAGRNPFGQMIESAGKLWLAEPGNFSDANETAAGIEVIDTTAMTSALVVPETTLGASVSAVAVNATCGVAIVADPTTVNATSLVSFALDGSSVSAPVMSTPDFSLRGLLWLPDGRLLVGDKTNTGGNFFVHVFSSGGNCALTKVADWPMPAMPALAFAN